MRETCYAQTDQCPLDSDLLSSRFQGRANEIDFASCFPRGRNFDVCKDYGKALKEGVDPCRIVEIGNSMRHFEGGRVIIVHGTSFIPAVCI